MRFGTSQIITNSSMSGTVISTGMDLQQDFLYSIQANWSGAAIGEFRLQVSNDNPATYLSGSNTSVAVSNWSYYTGSASSVTLQAGTSNFMWNVLYPGYRWVRLVYTASSGTGTLNAQFMSKG